MSVLFKHTDEDFHLIEYVVAITWLFSLSIIGKIIFAYKTKTSFIFTIANFIDITIVIIVAVMWFMASYYETRDITEPLFGDAEDQEVHVRLVGNIMADMESGVFHFDYLMAFVTACLWARCMILLRLTEQFGPLLVMIWNMVLIIAKFLFLYLINLIAFGAIATLTLSADDDFKDLFNATRTYFEASIGSFDLR